MAVAKGLILKPSYDQFCCKPGEDAILSCCLYPETSAVGMKIMWFKGTDCIYIYKSGRVRERNDYKGRLSQCLEELTAGKITLRLTHMKEQDSGNYMCEVIYDIEHKKCGLRVNFSPYSNIFVIYPYDGGTYVHDEDMEKMEVTAKELGSELVPSYDRHICLAVENLVFSCHFSPETNVLATEIRWFKGTNCIHLYKNGQVREGMGYEGRVNLCLEGLMKGRISLTLRDKHPQDAGVYACQVTPGECNECVFQVIHSPFNQNYVIYPFSGGTGITDEDRGKMEASVQELGSSRWAEKIKEKDQQIEHLTRKLQQYEEENKTKAYAMEQLVTENRRLHAALATLQQKYDNALGWSPDGDRPYMKEDKME